MTRRHPSEQIKLTFYGPKPTFTGKIQGNQQWSNPMVNFFDYLVSNSSTVVGTAPLLNRSIKLSWQQRNGDYVLPFSAATFSH